MQARNIIVEEAHNTLAVVMTKRKAIISRRRCIIEAKYLLTTESILNELIESEKMTKKRETREIKRRKAGQVKW